MGGLARAASLRVPSRLPIEMRRSPRPGSDPPPPPPPPPRRALAPAPPPSELRRVFPSKCAGPLGLDQIPRLLLRPLHGVHDDRRAGDQFRGQLRRPRAGGGAAARARPP